MNEIKTTFPDAEPKWGSIALRYGVILGFISSIITIISLATNSSGNFIIGTVSFLVTIVLLVKSNRDFKNLNNGFMKYGKGFKLTFVTVLISGIMSALVVYIYLDFIDPMALEGIKTTKAEFVEKIASWFGASLPEEELDKTIAKIDAETTPFSYFMETLSGVFFGALFLALIIPIFTKKNKPEFE